MDPDVRIGRSLPSGKLLVTCQIGAGRPLVRSGAELNLGWVLEESCVQSDVYPQGTMAFGPAVLNPVESCIISPLWHLGSSKPG